MSMIMQRTIWRMTRMQTGEALSAVSPLLRHRSLRVLLVAAPGLMAAVAILITTESNLALAITLNAAAGILVSSVLFIAVSVVARRSAVEQAALARAAEQGLWRARAQLLSIQSDDTGLYSDWYFRLRLQEEAERSKRYGVPFTVLVVKALGLPLDAQAEMAGQWFDENVRQRLRRSDLPALLHDGSLAVLLPHTARSAALQSRLAKAIASTDARIGIACFPEDGDDAKELLEAASGAATQQRDDASDLAASA
jgi:GGDEF domain-containing protein